MSAELDKARAAMAAAKDLQGRWEASRLPGDDMPPRMRSDLAHLMDVAAVNASLAQAAAIELIAERLPAGTINNFSSNAAPLAERLVTQAGG